MKFRFLGRFLLLWILLFVVASFKVNAAVSPDDDVRICGDYTYVIVNGYARVARFDSTVTGTARIPEQLDGYTVNSIDYWAFKDVKVTTIYIPATVTEIIGDAFNSKSIIEYIVATDNPNFCSDKGILYNKTKTTLYRCPGAKSGKFTIPDGVDTIQDHAFSCVYKLTEIVMPNGVKSIGADAFWGCTNLTKINLPNSVSEIKGGAFKNCRSLTELVIPNGTTLVGNDHVSWCYALKSITLPKNITNLPAEFLDGCRELESIVIPKTVKSIGSCALSSCDKLTDVYYLGTAEEWAQIDIHKANKSLFEATIHFAFKSGCNSETSNDYTFLAEKRPEYLSNAIYNNYLSTCNRHCYKVIDSYNQTQTGLLAFMEALANGSSIIVKEVGSKLGVAQSLQDEWLEKTQNNMWNRFRV